MEVKIVKSKRTLRLEERYFGGKFKTLSQKEKLWQSLMESYSQDKYCSIALCQIANGVEK